MLDARGTASIENDLRTLRKRGVRLLPGTLCIGLYDEENIAAALGPTEPFVLRFERLVVATGAYDRLPLVPGNDLPGVIGLRAFERLVAQRAFGRGVRVGLVGGAEEVARGRAGAERFGVPLAWSVELGGVTERLVQIDGRRRVRAARLARGGRRACDVLVVGGTQPTFELQVHAGRRAVVEGSPPVVRARESARMPLLVVGEASGRIDPAAAIADAVRDATVWTDTGEGTHEPSTPSLGGSAPADPRAFVCLCEDVRVRDITRSVAEGVGDIELVKRRTGATTGPCQGKLCLGLLCEILQTSSVPTIRPPVRPVRISALGGGS